MFPMKFKRTLRDLGVVNGYKRDIRICAWLVYWPRGSMLA
jgi:hypothetical protein